MKTLFAPSIALMSRLRYTSKFLLMGASVGMVMLVLLSAVFLNLHRNIKIAEDELAGLRILKPMNQMVQYMQQHRGLSSGVLNGNEAMKDQRASKELELAAAVTATENALLPQLRDSTLWKSIHDDWSALRMQGLSWAPPDNLKRHTQMIEKVLALMIELADSSQLTLDPEMNTYYFMDTVVSKMPAMLEPLGITRARGTGVLTKKTLTLPMRIDITATIGQMESTLRTQNHNLAKVMRNAPAVEPALAGPIREFTSGAERIFALVQSDILSEQFTTPPQEYFTLTTKVIDLGYKMMFETLIPQFEMLLKQRKETAQRQLILIIAIAGFIVLLVSYLGIGTYYLVINSVEVFNRGARQLAAGDLGARFDTLGHDELQEAGQNFNAMAASLSSLLGRLQRDVQSLRAAAEQLAASSSQISSGTGTQSDAASSMAASVEQMSAGIDHITRNAQDAQTYSQQSGSVSEQGSTIVQDVIDKIQGIATTVNQSAAAVEDLGQRSDQISAIVSTIKDIAGQTNLLALNAAIEAARAGESGRGFAVVADEVRKLAERTTKSTQEIADMISAIQHGTETAVQSMKLGVQKVATGVEQARAAGSAIEQVRSQAHQVVEAISGITNALHEQVAASNEIAHNVERIAQMAEENNAAATDNADTANRLRQMAETLSQEVARFKIH